MRSSNKKTPISIINANWLRRKHVYEKGHRYSGSPDIMIDRANVPFRAENPTDSKESEIWAVNES